MSASLPKTDENNCLFFLVMPAHAGISQPIVMPAHAGISVVRISVRIHPFGDSGIRRNDINQGDSGSPLPAFAGTGFVRTGFAGTGFVRTRFAGMTRAGWLSCLRVQASHQGKYQ